MNGNFAIKETLAARSKLQRGARLQAQPCAKLIATASSDDGVIRNGGRRGAAFAPKCILHAYKKFAQGLLAPTAPIQLSEVATGDEFETMQEAQKNRLLELLQAHPRQHVVHLGGGHDHVFPLLASLLEHHQQNIHVINIDAHLDTRNDAHAHSGTPFRQFYDRAGKRARITQIGIQDFANAASNWQDVTMNVHRLEKIEEMTRGFSSFDQAYLDQLMDLNKNEICLFSLDLDAINGAEMTAVSAVNPCGLPLMFVRALLRRYLEVMDEFQTPRLVGLYEFNPLYDDISGTAARTVAGLVHLALD